MAVENALLMCGSFNPVTNLHLRMMEIARDYLRDCGCTVSRGFLSPVHDKYKKEDMLPISHREAMLRLALESSEWIELSTWESQQSEWTRSYEVLRFHQDGLNCLGNDKNMNALSATSISDVNGNPGTNTVNVKYLMGADNLANFSVPKWDASDMERILIDHGMVVITRSGYDIDSIIYENDILFRNRKRFFVVKEYIENGVSSTKVRKACSRGQSIKYLVPDAVERYIKTHGLYSVSSKYGNQDSSFSIPASLSNDFQKRSKNIKKTPIPSLKNKPIDKKKKTKTKASRSSRRSKV